MNYECKHCGKQLEKKEKICPCCGNVVKRHVLLKTILIIIILFSFFGIIGSCNEKKEKNAKIETENNDGKKNILDYSSIQWTTWIGKEDDLLSTKKQYEINLEFFGNRTYHLIFKSVDENRTGWEHTSSYKIVDGKIILSLKRGEEIYGVINDDIIKISNWSSGDRDTFELKKLKK